MADIITHTFVTTKPDSPDPSLVSATEWNDGHAFQGGVTGQMLVFDTTQPKQMKWVDGPIAVNSGQLTPTGASPLTFTFITVNCNSASILYATLSMFSVTLSSANTNVDIRVDGVNVATYIALNNQVRTEGIAINLTTGAHTITATLTSAGTSFTSTGFSLVGLRIGRA